MYTWNLRTGFIDRLAGHTGLEFVGLTLKPGKWAAEKVTNFWDDYVYLVGVREDNRKLTEQLHSLKLDLALAREQARESERLKQLLGFSPPESWTAAGARIIANRLGPNAALDTVLLDKGSASGVQVSTPIITPDGVVGRVLKISTHFSTALLITDPSSKISVLGRDNRTPGILTGQGPNSPLSVNYVHQNAQLAPGEILVTSGLDEVFPKGLPVAVVTAVTRSDISLFQEVTAEPLVDLKMLEEVLLLMAAEARAEGAQPGGPDAAAPAEGQPGSQNATETPEG